jgi:hypothetical protein
MPNPNKPTLKEVPMAILVFVGSSVLSIPLQLKYLCQMAGLNFKQFFQSMSFDWSKNPPAPLLSSSAENIQIDHDEHVIANLDKSKTVLAEAENKGLFWAVEPDWHLHPGSVSDAQGAAGNPKNGYIITCNNDSKLKNNLIRLFLAAQDYIRAKNLALDGKGSQTLGRIPIILNLSTVGAMGTGAMNWFILEGIPDCAANTGTETKVILQLMLRGNLTPQDSTKATVNEYVTLKTLQVLASKRYLHPLNGIIQSPPFSQIQLSSNVNLHGNMTRLSQVMFHQAHLDYLIWCTPIGKYIRERACDIENWSKTQEGDPLCGTSLSIASITRNSLRVIQFCTWMAIGLFCEQLAAQGQNQPAIDTALALANSEKLVESQEDKGITSDLLRPQELDRQNVIQLAQDSVLQQAAGLRGLNKAKQLEEAIANSLANDLPSLYEPAIRLQAQARYESAVAKIKSTLHEKLRSAGRLTEIYQILICLKDILQNSCKMVENTLVELRQFIAPHRQILIEASAMLQQLNQKNKLVQGLSFLLIKRITQDLKQSGLAAISGELQILCCQTAIETLLTPLIGYLDDTLAWLGSSIRKMADIKQMCQIKADNLVQEDTSYLNPNGFEITTAQYLNAYWQDYIQQHGGASRFSDQLYSRFLKKHESFDIFIETAEQPLFDLLNQLFSEPFESFVKATTVWDELLRWFPEETLKQMIATLIQHSEGRVLAEDGVHQNIVWIKGGNIPQESCKERFACLLEGLDKKGGKWELAVHDDIDTISICQCRGQISLTPLIRRLGIEDTPEGWKSILEQAVDPVSALIISPNPTPRQIQRVLVKAIAAGLISVQNDCFYLENPPSEPVNLGRNASSVMTSIRPLWPQMVYIESYFARQLIIQEDLILGRLDQITAAVQSPGSQEDKRLTLVGTDAVMDCLRQVQIMLPRLRRMKKAALRETTL